MTAFLASYHALVAMGAMPDSAMITYTPFVTELITQPTLMPFLTKWMALQSLEFSLEPPTIPLLFTTNL